MAFVWKKKTYKTKYFDFEGLVSYPKVYEPDEYGGKSFWKVNLHPDQDTIDEIKRAGIQLKLKPSNEEYSTVKGKFFTFRRDVEKTFKGEVQTFNPPEIFDKDGNPVMVYKDNEAVGEKVLIGNGSRVRLDVEVYEAGSYGNGCRLKAIHILDLIKYDPDAKEEVPAKGEDTEVKEQVRETPEPQSASNKKVAW